MTEHARRIKKVFENIQLNRMTDMPMVNPALSVDVVGFEENSDRCVGILITPWCMNLMLMPQADEWSSLKPGTKQCHSLPSGQYEFVVAEEQGLGRFQSCSLFSLMFEFDDQEIALVTAQAALVAVMEEAQAPARKTEQEAAQSRKLSRRDFLRGGRR